VRGSCVEIWAVSVEKFVFKCFLFLLVGGILQSCGILWDLCAATLDCCNIFPLISSQHYLGMLPARISWDPSMSRLERATNVTRPHFSRCRLCLCRSKYSGGVPLLTQQHLALILYTRSVWLCWNLVGHPVSICYRRQGKSNCF